MKNQPERLLARGAVLADYVTPAERIGDECYLRTQRSRAIAWLGDRWRGIADCRHVAKDAHGRDILLDRRTLRRVE